MCQIASFYAGAMSEARNIELAPAVERTGADLVVISADDPAAMVRHSEECRERGYAFAADPSQQIARMDGPELIALIDGASLLFTNDYERRLLESKTGLTDADIHKMVDVRVCTLGSKGVEISGRDIETVTVAGGARVRQGRPDRRRRRVPGRLPGRARLGPVVGALGAGRRPARHAGARDRGHAGVPGQAARLRQPASPSPTATTRPPRSRRYLSDLG